MIAWMLTLGLALAVEEPLPPPEVTVEDLIALLAERSPDLAVERARVGIAEAALVQARILPNPTFDYGGFFALSEPYEIIDGGQHQPAISLPILIGGQIPARKKAARKEIEAAQEGYADSYTELARDARGLWVSLLASQQRVALLDEAVSVMERALDVVRQREELGVESRYEVTRLAVERAGLQARVAEARVERVTHATELAVRVGLPSWQPRATGPFAPLGFEGDVDRLWAEAVVRRPRLRAADREVEAAEARVRVARRDGIPTPSIGVGPFWSVDPKEIHPFVGFGIDLPFFDRNQGETARAVAETRAAEAERAAIRARARGELERSLTVLATRRSALDAFEAEVGERLPMLRRMAEDAYGGGQSGILELLDALSAVIEAQLDQVSYVEDVMQAELDVLTAAALIDVP